MVTPKEQKRFAIHYDYNELHIPELERSVTSPDSFPTYTTTTTTTFTTTNIKMISTDDDFSNQPSDSMEVSTDRNESTNRLQDVLSNLLTEKEIAINDISAMRREIMELNADRQRSLSSSQDTTDGFSDETAQLSQLESRHNALRSRITQVDDEIAQLESRVSGILRNKPRATELSSYGKSRKPQPPGLKIDTSVSPTKEEERMEPEEVQALGKPEPEEGEVAQPKDFRYETPPSTPKPRVRDDTPSTVGSAGRRGSTYRAFNYSPREKKFFPSDSLFPLREAGKKPSSSSGPSGDTNVRQPKATPAGKTERSTHTKPTEVEGFKENEPSTTSAASLKRKPAIKSKQPGEFSPRPKPKRRSVEQEEEEDVMPHFRKPAYFDNRLSAFSPPKSKTLPRSFASGTSRDQEDSEEDGIRVYASSPYPRETPNEHHERDLLREKKWREAYQPKDRHDSTRKDRVRFSLPEDGYPDWDNLGTNGYDDQEELAGSGIATDDVPSTTKSKKTKSGGRWSRFKNTITD